MIRALRPHPTGPSRCPMTAIPRVLFWKDRRDHRDRAALPDLPRDHRLCPKPPTRSMRFSPARPDGGFGTTTATFVIISSMIGVGVLTTSGIAVNRLGSNQLMLILWVIGGLIALCGALSLAEVSAALPRSGGEYAIFREVYGRLPAFLAGWVSFLFGFAGPIAMSATGASDYLLAPFGDRVSTSVPVRPLVASGLILVIAVIHLSGRARSTRLQGVVTLVELGFLITFVLAGLWAGRGGLAHLADRPPVDRRPWGRCCSACSTSPMVTPAGTPPPTLRGRFGTPTKPASGRPVWNPGRDGALPRPEPGVRPGHSCPGDPGPGPDRGEAGDCPDCSGGRLPVIRNGVGGRADDRVGLMMVATLSALLLTGPRVVFAMARDGVIPAMAGRASRRAGTPTAATLLLAGSGILLIWSGSFEAILLYSGIGLALTSLLSVAR